MPYIAGRAVTKCSRLTTTFIAQI